MMPYPEDHIMTKLRWIAGDNGNTLYADGYPIRIRRIRIRRTRSDPTFKLETDGHVPDAGYWGLESAKLSAEKFAAEMDEFCPPER
jgi:hypothetical protein